MCTRIETMTVEISPYKDSRTADNRIAIYRDAR